MFQNLLILACAALSAALSLVSTPYYDFSNGCPGLGNNQGLPPFLCRQASFQGNVLILSSLTHQVLRLAPDEDGIIQCSVAANLNGPSAASFSLGMAIDPSGRVYVSNTGTGPFTQDFGSVWTFSLDEPAPANATLFWTATSQFGLPSGLSVDWRNNQLLISSETDATSYYAALDSSAQGVWASAFANPDYALLEGTSGIPGSGGLINNTNLFGAPFGPVASSISNDGKTLYVGSADRGLLLGIAINNDGSAGALNVVGASPQHTIEGVFFDSRKSRVFWGTVFANGTNLSPDGPNDEYNGGVLAGNSIWFVNADGSGSSTQFFDARLGAICSVDGAQGVLQQGQKKLLAVSSGLDSFPGWPLGQVRSGLAPYPSGGVNGSTTGPALPNAYNAKVWVINLGDD
jgi:hypothetical protein